MRFKAMLLVGIVVAGLVAGGAYSYLRSQAVLNYARSVLAGRLSETLGVEVTVGRVEVTSYNTLTVYDAAVYDRQGRLAVSGGKLTVSFDPLALIRGQAAVQTVSQVEVSDFQLAIVRNPDGRWNFDDFTGGAKPEEPGFRGRVVLHDGTASIHMPEGAWNLNDIHGETDFSRSPAVAVNLFARQDDFPVSIAGTLDQTRDSFLNITAKQVHIEEFLGFLPADSSARVNGGTAGDVDLAVRWNRNGLLQYSGETRLTDFSADAAGYSLREGNGLVAFTERSLYLYDFAARVAGQELHARGRIALDGSEPVFFLDVAAPALDPRAIRPGLPVTGTAAVRANLSGTPSHPSVIARVSSFDGEYDGWPIGGLQADVRFNAGLVTIDSLTADMLGGRMAASGTVELASGMYRLAVSGDNIDSASVESVLPGMPLTGRGRFAVQVTGQNTLTDCTVFGTAQMGPGELAQTEFSGLEAGFYHDPSRTVLDYLTVHIGAGQISATGTVTGRALQFNVTGSELPLAVLTGHFDGLDAAGTVSGAGMVSGTLDRPEAAGSFTAADGRIFAQPYDRASGTFQLNPDSVLSADMKLFHGGAEHDIAGTIQLTGRHELAVRVNTHQARAENLVALIAPGEKLTGNVDNEMVLTGPLDDMNIDGRVVLTEGSFRGYLVAKAAGSYTRRHGLTELRGFQINSINTDITLNGVIQPDNSLNLDIGARNIDMGKLHVHLPYDITGRAAFAGKLTGTPQDPVFSGEYTAAALTISGQNVQNVAGVINIHGSQLDIPRIQLNQDGGVYRFAGGTDLEDGAIYGQLEVENTDVANLLAALKMPDQGIGGKLTGNVAIRGTRENPGVTVTGHMQDMRIRSQVFNSVEIDASLDNHVITVNQFAASQGHGMLAASGTADLNGALNLEIGGRNLDAGLVTCLSDKPIDILGNLNFSAQLSGTAQDPHAAVSLDISDGRLANAAFDALYGLFLIDKNNINVNQFYLTKGPYRASAYGLVPIKALHQDGLQQASAADQMDLRFRLDEANLSILPLLSSEVAWASGATKGEIRVTGTLAQPSLHGSLSVVNGVIKLKSLADPIQKVGVDIQLEDDTMNIKSFSGSMGSGMYQLSGFARLGGHELTEYDLDLQLNNLGINHKYFHGPVNGELKLTKTADGRPLLAGKLLFENDTIGIPYLSLTDQSAVDMDLNVELTAGKKVRLYNAYLYDIWAEGHAKFSGSTRHPSSSGRFDAIRGTVSYLRTPFTVKSASAAFTRFGSFEPVVQMEAETKLEQTTVTLNISGPVSRLKMNLTSSPEMSQQEIFSLLTLRSRYFDKQKNSGASSGLGRDELVGLLDAGLQMRFITELEDSFRNAFGVDEFKLVQSTAPLSKTDNQPADQERYDVELTKYIGDRLMISYTMGLTHSEQIFGVQYDITKRLKAVGEIGGYNKYRLGLEMRFHFK